jgi:hypothetical protein
MVNQYSETNVMHLPSNLLRIKGLYMFRTLLAHPQEVLHKRHWYIECVLRERGQLGDPDVDGRIILRWIFRKLEAVVGTGWSWIRIGTGGGHL